MTALRRPLAALPAAILLAASASTSALACACGCGVFGVGTASLFPSGSGGQAWFEYDYMNQDRNRSGETGAPLADNDDRQIETDFFNLGGQYMFNRSWGVTVEVPYWTRTYRGGDVGDANPADEYVVRHSGFGDVRVMGMYTGFSPDMSTGVTFGLKLPSGDFSDPDLDRDTQIGTGSTDLLLGGYHLGALNKANTLSYFAQALWDRPLAYQGGYRPGQEVDAAAGVIYTGFTVGKVTVAPLAQVIGSHRAADSGPAADPDNTGYDRVMVSPGVEVDYKAWRAYADVEFPVYQRFNGNQLAAPDLLKVIFSRSF